jgi:NAD(P)-dependent dehydrogenase (short-subunit alcohol dehydrogenase family)
MSGSNPSGAGHHSDPCAADLDIPHRGFPWVGNNVVVIGGSRGVGRQIVECAACSGAHVMAVARQVDSLREVAQQVPGVEVLSLDATGDDAPSKVFDALLPDVLILCAGAFPPVAPLHKQSWQEFAVNWETDVKIAFNFCKAALSRPLTPGASVLLMSSVAALGGSPITGGYAGAKRTQMFIANYSQKESDRLGLGLRFITLASCMVPDTELGKHAVAGYSRYLGMCATDVVQSMDAPPTPSDVATAVTELVKDSKGSKGRVFLISGNVFEAIPPWQRVEEEHGRNHHD